MDDHQPTTPQEAYTLARAIGERHAASVDDGACRPDDAYNFRPCASADVADFAHFDDIAGEVAAYKRRGKV